MKISYREIVLSFLFIPLVANAAELVPIPTEDALGLGRKLVEQAAKIATPQITINAEVEKANGVHVQRKMGILVVPQKDLKESEELAAKFKTDSGASLAYLFLHHLVPVVDGKRIDEKKLRSVTITDKDGASHTVHVLLLAIRQPSPDDYRLYAYGQDAKPIVDAKFAEGAGPGPEPVAVEVKNPNESTHEGTIAITVFGKYQATFTGAYTGE